MKIIVVVYAMDTEGEADLQSRISQHGKSSPKSLKVHSYTQPGNVSPEKDTGKQIPAF